MDPMIDAANREILDRFGLAGWAPSDTPPCCSRSIEDHLADAERHFTRFLEAGRLDMAAGVLEVTREWLYVLREISPPGLGVSR